MTVNVAGGLGMLPSSSELASGGVRELEAEEEEAASASREPTQTRASRGREWWQIEVTHGQPRSRTSSYLQKAGVEDAS